MVICLPVTATARIRALASWFDLCGSQNGTGTVSVRVLRCPHLAWPHWSSMIVFILKDTLNRRTTNRLRLPLLPRKWSFLHAGSLQKFQPVHHTVYTSPTTSSNQYTTPSTNHLQLVPTSISHRLYITYSQFQPVYHTVYTSPTVSSNQYTTPSTHHLQSVQPVYHTVYTSPTVSSNQYITPSTHHLHAALKLTTSVHQASLSTD